MPNHQLLDNVSHKDLRIITAQRPELGDTDSYARVVLSELKLAQSSYPLFFRKQAETGQFEIIAMFGLDASENVFLDDNGWHAHYLPLSIQRRPFLIGYQANETGEDNPVIHIDMDSPRISESEGEAIFLPQGGQSDYLQHVGSVLNALHQGLPQTQPFVDALVELELIETVELKVKLDDGNTVEVTGLYTIQEENLRNLSGDAVAKLHAVGYLEPIYMMLASLQNLTKVIQLKNLRLAK